MRSEESFLTILYNHCTIKNILKINNEPMLIAFVHLISQHTDWFREVYQNACIQFTYGDSFAAVCSGSVQSSPFHLCALTRISIYSHDHNIGYIRILNGSATVMAQFKLHSSGEKRLVS